MLFLGLWEYKLVFVGEGGIKKRYIIKGGGFGKTLYCVT
jgi:hypothetical protein